MLELNHQIPARVHREGISVPLTIEQLWTGLLLRVLEPTRFTVGLDRAEIESVSEGFYRRALHFGAQVIEDEVHLVPRLSVQFTTVANERVPQGTLRYVIMGEADNWVVHCEYHTAFPEPDGDEERQMLEMVKNAYRMADEDMLRIIGDYALMARH